MVKIDLTQVVGQTLPQNILKKTLQNQKLASAYLFYGPEGLGKWVAALELAKALNCENKDSVPCQVCSNCVKIAKLSHPDVVLVFPVPSTKKEEENLRQKYIASFRGEKLKEPYALVEFEKNALISKDRMNELKTEVSRRPFEAKTKVVIINQAEKMMRDSFNSFLKVLEEPPAYVHLILTTSQPERLLPTVISRCQKIRFTPIKAELVQEQLVKRLNLDEKKALTYARLSDGSLGYALSLAGGKWDNLRELGLRYLQNIFGSEISSAASIIEDVVKQYSIPERFQLFKFLKGYLRDVAVFKENPDKKHLFDAESSESILKLAQRVKNQKQIEKSINLIEKTKSQFYLNVNPRLALLHLALQLRNIFYPNLGSVSSA
ncbi:MAG: hypothetical protein RBG1_1C00001G0316 [candidate division Zixibacteria bacterium RBG-1]|nr:MAG: hypothetical protein RBG1_1C00001G0316 [candidate division Zixibacteria bacterium RBG-1]OGC83152.1 MAG: hypothetical protein A2V73_06940 [candidate division Zixibacteria bacterium RBG_19FT_COMBO_42_43]